MSGSQIEARGAMEEHPPISADSRRETVKDLTKKAKFGVACDRLRGWTERAEVVEGSLREDLLAAIARSGTVLRSRHAQDSCGWRHGLRLFEVAAVAFEGHDDAGKISELLEAAALTVDADDDETAKNVIGSEANEDRNAPKAFEGQFSGEVESEFDRQRRTAGPGTDGSIPAELFEMFRDPTETAERRRDALTAWLSSAHPSSNTAVDVDALMEVLSGFDASSFGSDAAVDGAGFGARRTMGSAGSDALAALAERVVTLRTGDDVDALGESECPICRDDFDVGSRVIKMPCARTHVFHRDCVATWLRKDDSCPLCRSSLPIWLGRPQYA